MHARALVALAIAAACGAAPFWLNTFCIYVALSPDQALAPHSRGADAAQARLHLRAMPPSRVLTCGP